ncbi:MAG: cysteine desulfurase NifS [Verrucomicrobia bacterium]|nr:MAG: cysteine desulfurase NifS [Verrucomicrobiota bacterium]
MPLHYLDNNATTRVAPEVLEAMLPYLREHWGNPSSSYAFGHNLTQPLSEAREKAAALLNADPREIIFTSCGTESSNAAIHSTLATQPGKRHVVTTSVEHSANLKFCSSLQKQGCEITILPVDEDGALDLDRLEAAIRPDTALVSVMWANNETGVLFPIAEVAAICARKGALCHTDAVQAPSKLKIDVKELGVDFLSLSAHKFYAPKGIGVLYVKRHTKFESYLLGGSQELGRRAGTENVPYIIGCGRAAELALARLEEQNTRVRALRDKLEQGILTNIPGTTRNGPEEPRLPNTTNIAFEDIEAEGILLLLDRAGICASSGSACHAGSLDPSHVLTAMGLSAARARGSVRFSLGIYNTQEDVDYTLECLPDIVRKLRAV